MSRCGLEDLDGLASMNSLRELYLSYNEIYDLSPCSMLEHVKILDLEGYTFTRRNIGQFVKTILTDVLARKKSFKFARCDCVDLSLRRNNLEELSQVEFLALCSTLTHLTLEGNPLCTTPNPDEAAVSRLHIFKSCRQMLERITDQLLTSNFGTRSPSTSSLWVHPERVQGRGCELGQGSGQRSIHTRKQLHHCFIRSLTTTTGKR